MFFLRCRDRKAAFVAPDIFSHILPIDRARELIEPSQGAESLLASFFKKCEHFCFLKMRALSFLFCRS